MNTEKYAVRRSLSVDERNAIGGTSDLVAHLLYHRGVTDALSAIEFLAPSYDQHLHDPFLLKDAEKAADRIIRAIETGERIAFYCDYDADGIPGSVMWNDFMRRIGYDNYTIYIPHRHNEGFGVNESAVEQLAQDGVRLMVTLDCGISDVGPIARAVQLGMDVIVTDHHEPPVILPSAYAIVDHKQKDCAYPDKNICGSGVGFKVIQAILKKAKSKKQIEKIKIPDGHEKWLLDMVGIATLSDMVPLVGENRVLASYGLQVLRKSPRKGLIQLLRKLKIDQRHLTEDDIGFMVTPRINAASRMGVPMDAFKLLAAETDTDADLYAAHLDEINNERKGIVASLVKEAKRILKERYGENAQWSITNDQGERSLPPVIVLGNPEWKPSLLGLVANTCAEEFGRPAFLWGRDGDGIIKGSCRSGQVGDVVQIMRAVPEGVFLQYGGHTHSGGFAVHGDQIHYFEERLIGAAQSIASDTQGPKESVLVDAELRLDDVTWRLQEDISKLGPFGIGNSKPLFIFRSVKPDKVRTFGKSGDHVELGFKKTNGSAVSAIAFFAAESEWFKTLHSQPGKAFDLVATIEKSMFRGRPELRLRVEDVVLLPA